LSFNPAHFALVELRFLGLAFAEADADFWL
jgi:hypothetical protein